MHNPTESDELRALPDTRQIRGERQRQWYFSNEMDLFVWFDADNEPCSFQLTYDCRREQRTVTWHEERGFGHFRVEDDRAKHARAGTPLLKGSEPLDVYAVRAQFRVASGGLPDNVKSFVSAKLDAVPRRFTT